MKIQNKFAVKQKKGITRTQVRIAFALILIIAILGAFFDFPKAVNTSIDTINAKMGTAFPHFPSQDFHLGLDLQGGTHLIYQADVSQVPSGEKDDAVEGVRDVIERRVNAFGVAEPIVQTTKSGGSYRVIVELAGVKDVKEAIKMIGETPLLEFKEQNPGTTELTEEQKQEMEEYNEEAKQRAQDILKQARNNPDNFTELVREYSEDEITMEKDGEIGYLISDGFLSMLYEAVSPIAKGQIAPTVVENDEGFNILKRGEQDIQPEYKANHILICHEGKDRCESGLSQEDAWNKIQELKEQVTTDNFIDLAKENSTEPGADQSGGDLGWFKKGTMVPPFEEAVIQMSNGTISDIVETSFGYHLIYKTDERSEPTYQTFRILIKKKTEEDYVPQDEFLYTGLTGKHLKKAQVEFDPMTNEPNVNLEFNDEGKDLFAEITERNVNKLVGIFLDGQPISVPRVNEKITGGSAVITGKFTLEEAKTLTRRLNAGALPVPIEIISQQTVGATLGQESVQQSLTAAIWGLIFVALFMILYYRLPGVLSVLSLMCYGIIILALFKLVPVTLTLAGIAGFILSIGMAVDANVLIFERMKEELSMDKPLGSSITEGFKRAWPSIRDGNISTLITCLILGFLGTSVVKGFALTLGIGIIISMFSAIVITNIFLRFVAGWKPVQQVNWLFLYRKATEPQSETEPSEHS